MHSIKINRALRTAAIGANPGSADDMLAAIPTAVVSALSGARLAELLDAMWALAGASKALAIKDAVDEGALWDGQRLREIAA